MSLVEGAVPVYLASRVVIPESVTVLPADPPAPCILFPETAVAPIPITKAG